MFVDFDELPDSSRIWVYTCDRSLKGEDMEWLSSSTKAFLEKWTAHGNDLKSSYTFLYNHILIIGLDEEMADASGCSIDASVHFIQGMGAHFKTDFFNRTLVPFVIDEKVELQNLTELKAKLKEGSVSADSVIFNTLITKKSDLNNALTPLKESWLKTYLKIEDIPA